MNSILGFFDQSVSHLILGHLDLKMIGYWIKKKTSPWPSSRDGMHRQITNYIQKTNKF